MFSSHPRPSHTPLRTSRSPTARPMWDPPCGNKPNALEAASPVTSQAWTLATLLRWTVPERLFLRTLPLTRSEAPCGERGRLWGRIPLLAGSWDPGPCCWLGICRSEKPRRERCLRKGQTTRPPGNSAARGRPRDVRTGTLFFDKTRPSVCRLIPCCRHGSFNGDFPLKAQQGLVPLLGLMDGTRRWRPHDNGPVSPPFLISISPRFASARVLLAKAS